MSKQTRAIFLFLTIVAVLFVSAFGTTNVYADDGTPPPPETGEVDPSNGEGEVVVTEPSDTESTPSDGTPVVEEPAPAEADAGTTPEEAPTEVEAGTTPEEAPAEADAETAPEEAPAEAGTILEQVPVNTTVTVLDAEGEAQPLTSQESVDAILVSDPIWCPEGQSPTPGLNGCTTSYGSFTELLSFLQANEGDTAYQQAGTIYVQKDVYAGGESSIDFNSYNFQTINNYNLTVRGGWDTEDNSLEPTDMTQFDVPIIIGSSANPWVGSLTFNNISISGVYNQAGLTLFSQGNIILSNVEVTDSQSGAALTADGSVIVQNSKFNDNKKSGATINAGRTVSITNSEFNDNESSKYDGFGLQVDSLANVFLSQVTARNNEKFGADISAAGPVIVVNSVFSGNVSYSYSCWNKKTANGGYGLNVVTTAGPVVLDGVTANDNYFFGAHLEGSGVFAYNSSFSNNGSGSMSNPKGYGLEALSTGGVTLVDVKANNNQLFGANVKAADDVVIQRSFFNGNKSYKCSCNGTSYYGYGLQVVTTGDGDINLLQVTADGNNLFGAHLDGASVAIADSSFSNNGSGSSSTLTGKGLEIISRGTAVLANITANNNQLFGANIQAVDDVLLATSVFSGNVVYTTSCKGKTVAGGGYGLQIVVTGENSNIAMSGVHASDNYLFGAHLVASDVAISGDLPDSDFAFSLFNNNKEGLKIESSGAVSLDDVKANDNRLSGATILAGTNEDADGSVVISNSFFNGNHSYTSSSCKGKTYYGYGLKVVTTADYVNLSVVEANNNYLFGAHLEGANITVSSSSFSNNGTGVLSEPFGKGLEIESTGGPVSLYEVTANDNQLFGANINAKGSVDVRNSFFNGNKSYKCSCNGTTYYGYGLQVITTSEVSVREVTAEYNYLFGAHLEGTYVSVRDSSFSFNSSPNSKNATGRGLEVKSAGDVLLRYVTANNNQLFGANIQADGQVTVLSSVFASNKYYTYSSCKGSKAAGYGLKVVAVGPITLGSDVNDISNSGVQAYANGAEGAILEGESTVAVTGGQFNNNGTTGLTITTDDTVTLTNVTATGNGQDGVNVTGICGSTVNVNGGTFTNNGGYGIKVVKATYTPDGAQTFANNQSGNVFQNSSTCVSSGNNNNNNSNGSGYNHSNHHHGYGYWSWWYSHRR